MHEPISLSRSTQFVVLTGAGISAESGIATFRGDANSAAGRDGNGLWEQHAVEDVASPEGWERDAALVWRFYSERRANAAEAKPNAGHLALARVQKYLGTSFTLVTQNVDNLHEQAGSTNVIHMHGELFKTRCENPDCKLVPFEDRRLYTQANALPRCSLCRARLRPHIVWFGEIPLELHPIKRKVEDCDLFGHFSVAASRALFGLQARAGSRRYSRGCRRASLDNFLSHSWDSSTYPKVSSSF